MQVLLLLHSALSQKTMSRLATESVQCTINVDCRLQCTMCIKCAAILFPALHFNRTVHVSQQKRTLYLRILEPQILCIQGILLCILEYSNPQCFVLGEYSLYLGILEPQILCMGGIHSVSLV